jgi:hypothetical protein
MLKNFFEYIYPTKEYPHPIPGMGRYFLEYTQGTALTLLLFASICLYFSFQLWYYSLPVASFIAGLLGFLFLLSEISGNYLYKINGRTK